MPDISLLPSLLGVGGRGLEALGAVGSRSLWRFVSPDACKRVVGRKSKAGQPEPVPSVLVHLRIAVGTTTWEYGRDPLDTCVVCKATASAVM